MLARTVRILFVEDNLDTATIVGRILRHSGYAILHAATLAAALAIVEKEMAADGLDLVVSDLGLPDGSGLDLMHELSAKYGLRGIAVTGFGMASDRELTTRAGFCRHLTKPVKVAALLTAIAELTQVSA